MKIASIILEATLPTHQVLPDDLHHLLNNITPDVILNDYKATFHNKRAFIYVEDGELIWLPGSKDEHCEWVDENRPDIPEKYGQCYPEPECWLSHCVLGRYGLMEEPPLSILSLWAFKERGKIAHLILPALQAIRPFMPPNTYVTPGSRTESLFMPFMLNKQAQSGRGHRYWQLRQTSESITRT